MKKNKKSLSLNTIKIARLTTKYSLIWGGNGHSANCNYEESDYCHNATHHNCNDSGDPTKTEAMPSTLNCLETNACRG